MAYKQSNEHCYLLMSWHVNDGGCLHYWLVNTLDENPISTGHPVYFNSVPNSHFLKSIKHTAVRLNDELWICRKAASVNLYLAWNVQFINSEKGNLSEGDITFLLKWYQMWCVLRKVYNLFHLILYIFFYMVHTLLCLNVVILVTIASLLCVVVACFVFTFFC